MNLDDVAGELGAALRTIDGLNVPEWGVDRVHPPFALIPLPDPITYDTTHGRGSDRIEDWPVLVLVAKPTQPAARRAIAEYADGSGPKSVKAAIEARTYTSCDSVRVATAEFDVVTYAGTDYLAAMFHLDITGKGA
ncbi:hypothetical protein E1211_15235 [Micromonospora sp. 15K316]|uniref:hypothetical protein n=1 Tax=unclassified Micromonospora TaxID=2617518 RepID=UPI0010429D7F|nr:MULTISPECIES: hypothetical protein [unclassified Micromonospora]TDB71802.1 hypothetical protein E1165_21990 [Micromonospora sp. KC723]TDC35659.1 hypothetical protein E1211_15235 [Micromonospora sp. 15K316]